MTDEVSSTHALARMTWNVGTKMYMDVCLYCGRVCKMGKITKIGFWGQEERTERVTAAGREKCEYIEVEPRRKVE